MSSEPPKNPISVCVLTKNNEQLIRECLSRLAGFEEILVLDTGSTDQTLEIVASFPNARLFHQDGIRHFGETRDFITSKAKNDWILHIDSDEFVSPELKGEIESMTLDPNTVYEIYRRTFYRGKALPAFNDRIRRFYNKNSTGWSPRAVHEVVEVRNGMTVGRLKSPVEHHSYHSVKQLVQKAQLYSSMYADQFHTTRKAGAWVGVFHGLWSFFRFYFLKGNILYGYEGFITSTVFSFMSFLKYVKVLECNQDEKKKTKSHENDF